MALQYHPILFIFIFGALISLGVAFYCFRYIRENSRDYLVTSVGLLAFNNFIWTVAATLKVVSTDLQMKLLFYKLEFLGSAFNPSIAVVLALTYIGYEKWLNREVLSVLGLIPVLSILLIFINPNDLMISEPVLVSWYGIESLEHEFPPLFLVFMVWALGSALLSGILIGFKAIFGRFPYIPSILVAFTLILPVIVISIKIMGIYPQEGSGVNITPAINGVAILFLSIAVIKYRVFELTPVGRDQVIDMMHDGYILVNSKDVIVDINPAATEILGYNSDKKIIGGSLDDVLPINDFNYNSKSMFSIEDRVIQVSSSEVTRLKETLGYILIFHDITERKKNEKELEKQRDNLELLNTVLRHDIRNDLQLVNLHAEFLEENIDEEGKNHLSILKESVSNAVNLTSSARDLAEVMLESDPEMKSVSVFSTFRKELEEVRTSYPKADITVEGSIPKTEVVGSSLLGAVFRNLLNNAIQHNNKETPEITVSAEEKSDFVEFRIKDNGPGIPDPLKKEIFKENKKSFKSKGSGIGLYLVHSLVNSYGGSVSIEDNKPTGTIFILNLPIAN